MVVMGGHRNGDRFNPRARCVELNEFISCLMCEGYLIDATTVIECLHSFCKTCIVKHLKTDNSCPRCKTQVHKTKPLRGLRSDPTLQDIVYKVVPGLYKDEMRRRRSLYTENPDAAKNITSGEEKGEYSGERTIYSSQDVIPISLQYVPREINYSYQPMKDQSGAETRSEVANTLGEHGQVRFFRCVSAVTIRILKKLLRNKFDLKYHHDVHLFYKHDPLLDEYSILDLAYIYCWKRNVPLSLYYQISDLRTVTIKSTGTRVPAKRKSAHATTKTTPPAAAEQPVLTVAGCPPPSLTHKIPVTMPITISTTSSPPLPPLLPPPPPQMARTKISGPDPCQLGGLEAVRREAASILKEVEESQRKQHLQLLNARMPEAVVVAQSGATAASHENPLAQDLNKITQLVANIRPNGSAEASAVKKRKIVREPRGRKPKGVPSSMSGNPNGRGRPATVRDLITAQPSAFRKIAPSPHPFLLQAATAAAFALPRKSLQQQQSQLVPQPSASHLLNSSSNPAADSATVAAAAANILSNGELTITCTNGTSALPSCATVTNPVVHPVHQPNVLIPLTSMSSSSSSSLLNPSLIAESETKVIRSDSNASSVRERQSSPTTIDSSISSSSSQATEPAKPGTLLEMAQLIMGVPASTTVSLAPASSSSASSSSPSPLCKPVNGQSDGTKIGSVIEKLAAKATGLEPPLLAPIPDQVVDDHKGEKEKEGTSDANKREPKSGDESAVGKSLLPKTVSHLPLAPLTSYPAAGVQPLRKPSRIPCRANGGGGGGDEVKKRVPVFGKSKDDSDLLFAGIEGGKCYSPESHLIPALNLSSANFKVPYPPDHSSPKSVEMFSDENGQKNVPPPLSSPSIPPPQGIQRMTSSPKQI